MVGKRFAPRLLLVVTTVAALLLLTLSPAAAQGIGEEGEYDLYEEFRIEVNEVGDAHITDTITYDPVWFEEFGYLFEENPNLLTRRYRADSNVGEVENFDVDIDAGDATITVSFDTPGLAYNLGDGWELYGYGQYSLVDEGADEVSLQAAWTLTSEYTLFEPMGLAETVVVVLPDGAQDASFDAENGTIRWDVPYAAAGAGVLADNKTLFTLVFALLMALSLIALLYAFTRKAKEPVAPATVAAAATPYAPPQAPPAAAAGAADAKKFCRKCGHPRGGEDERFCRKCGLPHG